MQWVLLWSVVVWASYTFIKVDLPVLNFTPIGIIGSALAIFVAFRNNSAYGRWWEARTLWGGIVNSSRVLARLIVTFTDSHTHQDNYQQDRSESFKREMIYKCIAWVHALRVHLRHQDDWSELQPFLTGQEYHTLLEKDHKPNFIHLLMGQQIYTAMANGTLGGFDSFQMEGQLLALTNYQGGCERIKNTPLPRQYDFFTRLFVYLFAFLVPIGIIGFFQSEALQPYSWIVIPLSFLVSMVFVIMERTGAVNEDPFENQITDVPLTSICNTIERNLRELLGEANLPEKTKVEDGYLY